MNTKFVRALLKRKIFWLLLVVMVGGGYWWYRANSLKNVPPQYVLSPVEKGTLTVFVSGSGQVSASNQLDVKPEVSGTVLRVMVTDGAEVKRGALLAELNASDANKAVRDAELNLESAKLTLKKLVQPADNLSVIQSENALAQARLTKQSASDDLIKTYDSGFNTVSNAFLDLPTIITGLHDLLYGNSFATGQWNMDYYVNAVTNYDDKVKIYRDDAAASYQVARAAYDKNFIDFKSINRTSDNAAITATINETYATAQSIGEAIKSASDLIQFYEDRLTERSVKPSAVADAALTSLGGFTGKINTHLSNLLTIKQTIQSDTDAIVSADRTINEKTASLAKLTAGPDPLDVQSQELAVRQRQAAYDDARAKLADYFIRAPMDGIVAKVGVKNSDQAGASTIIATIITPQKVAEISLNEVDVAKIKTGQKVTLTFDAIEDLNLTGIVSEIESIGTVSQGVVSYSVKIISDTQDVRVKPGMSVSANIITEVKQDTLIVPNSAIKTQGNQSYVEMLDSVTPAAAGSQGVTSPTAPRRQPVQVGISNDTETEIISGLAEGDQVVTRTIGAVATKTTTQSAPSLFPTGGGGGRNGFRVGG